jgi:5'-3' exonuclease
MGPHGVGYKAGRAAKPHYLKFIKELLKEQYNAQEIKGFEADDALGMFANSRTILSHIDKDIDMIGGCWHYNHVTHDVYYVEDGLGHLEFNEEKNKVIGRGLIFFYIQMLTGDAIDNIPGCKNPEKVHFAKPPNISAKEAYRILQGVASEDVAFNYVAQMYQHTYQDRWLEAIQEMADLLWICKSADQTGRQYLKHKGYV